MYEPRQLSNSRLDARQFNSQPSRHYRSCVSSPIHRQKASLTMNSMPWYSYMCHGWPRAKENPGNWINESSNYVWNIAAESWNGGSYHPPDTHACPPEQRTPTYQPNAPMVTASAGDIIRLRFGGNGHSRGFDVGGNPGTVTVYWKGAPEQEITDISEFTPQNSLQSAGFSADSFSYPADPSITSPTQGLVDKGNWMELNLPTTMAPGRHMMAWVWYYENAPQWSTCFDVMIQGSPATASSASAVSPSSTEVNEKVQRRGLGRPFMA